MTKKPKNTKKKKVDMEDSPKPCRNTWGCPGDPAKELQLRRGKKEFTSTSYCSERCFKIFTNSKFKKKEVKYKFDVKDRKSRPSPENWKLYGFKIKGREEVEIPIIYLWDPWKEEYIKYLQGIGILEVTEYSRVGPILLPEEGKEEGSEYLEKLLKISEQVVKNPKKVNTNFVKPKTKRKSKKKSD